MYEEVSKAFCFLSDAPIEITEECLSILECYPILLYDHTSTLDNIDEAHQELFAKKGRPVDAIPPTKAALVQHTRRQSIRQDTSGDRQ